MKIETEIKVKVLKWLKLLNITVMTKNKITKTVKKKTKAFFSC